MFSEEGLLEMTPKGHGLLHRPTLELFWKTLWQPVECSGPELHNMGTQTRAERSLLGVCSSAKPKTIKRCVLPQATGRGM